jgi:tRNA threonylcarbamoyladenosine biosynthesis protein TsaE
MTQPHPKILGTLQLRWPNEAACAASAAALARRCAPALRDAVVELEGPLGAGKTTFARHLLHALGVRGRVKSPTYAVLEPYDVDGLRVAHFDFYRFDDPQEWEDAGLRDEFGAAGLKLVEWAAKAAPLLPAPDLRIVLAPVVLAPVGGGADGDANRAESSGMGRDAGDGARDVRCEAYTPKGMGFIEGLAA